MKKLISLTILTAIILAQAGCASFQGGQPVEVQAVPGGAQVGVNPAMLDQVWAWVKENPKATLVGVGTGIYAGYKVSQQNDWFGLGDRRESAGSSATTSTSMETKSKTYTVYVGDVGNNNTLNIYQVSPTTTTGAQ